MKVERLNGLTKLIADFKCKITDTNKTFFSDHIYIGRYNSIEDYTEVKEDVWGEFVKEADDIYNSLNEKIKLHQNSIYALEEMALDNDYRLELMDKKFNIQSASLNLSFDDASNNVILDLLLKRIDRRTYTSKENMKIMLDTYLSVNRITIDQYNKLIVLLDNK